LPLPLPLLPLLRLPLLLLLPQGLQPPPLGVSQLPDSVQLATYPGPWNPAAALQVAAQLLSGSVTSAQPASQSESGNACGRPLHVVVGVALRRTQPALLLLLLLLLLRASCHLPLGRQVEV
jgi:hypothetical protein